MGRCLVGCLGVLLLAACGDNVGAPDIEGIYVADVDVHEKPCGSAVEAGDVSDPWFVPMTGWEIQIDQDPDRGASVVWQCWAHTTGDCGIWEGFALTRSHPDAWDGVTADAFEMSDGTGCALSYGTLWVTQIDDAHISWDLVWHKETGAHATPCTQSEAFLRSTSMPCYKHEHVEATLRP